MSKPTVIFLMGATASGKTDLAMRLCDVLPCDLINVDSAQVYRQLNVGAAKPSLDQLANYPHRLLDVRDPVEVYSVAEFRADALIEIEQIVKQGRIPLLVGGSMMYFKALLDDLADMPEADEQIRQRIAEIAGKEGWPAVHAELAKVDPDMAATIHPNHSQRLSRALEVFYASGKTMTELRQLQQSQLREQFLEKYHLVQFSLALEDRNELHRRINLRFEQMLAEGLIAEVEILRARGDLNKDLPAIRSVGYRQVWEYLDGDYDYDTMVAKGQAATRQLAKRQLTWLRNWPYEIVKLDAALEKTLLLEKIQIQLQTN